MSWLERTLLFLLPSQVLTQFEETLGIVSSPIDHFVRCQFQTQRSSSCVRMHANTSTRLHCGCIDIGHSHGRLDTRAVSQRTNKRPCNVPERVRGAFLGRSLEQNALATYSKKQGRPAARGTVQTSAVFGFFRGDAGEKTRKKYQAQVDAINRLEPEMQSLSDEQLADKTKDLKSRAQKNGSVDDLLVEAFAVSYDSLASSLMLLVDSSLAR